MSKNLPQPSKSDDIDILEIFRYFGKGVKSFIDFISDIFKSLFKLLIISLLFVRKHLTKIVLAAAIGYIVGSVIDHFSKSYYSSTMIVQPNFNSTNQLIDNIRLYRALAYSQDSITLAEIFNISDKEAGMLLDFKIEPKSSYFDNLRSYDNLIKSSDTSVARNVDFESYVNNLDKTGFSTYYITVASDDRRIFKKLEDSIINISAGSFLLEQQKVELKNISLREKTVEKSLREIDSLRSIYYTIIKENDTKIPERSNSGNNFYMSGNSLRKTNEIDLFALEKELNEELIVLNQEKFKKQNLINVQAKFLEEGVLVKERKKFNYVIGAVTLMVLALLLFEFNKFLNNYEKKLKIMIRA